MSKDHGCLLLLGKAELLVDLSWKLLLKKANLWQVGQQQGTRRESPKEERGKKSDLSTDVPAPSTLTPQIQITSSPNTSTTLLPSPRQGTALGTGLPWVRARASQPCMWGLSTTDSERTNSPPCSLSSSGHRHLHTLSATRQLRSCRGCQCCGGHQLWSRAVHSSPWERWAPPETAQENFLERTSLVHKHFFLPRGDFLSSFI